VDEPKAINEFKKDEYLAQKFENWKTSLLSILIHLFKKYKKDGLIEPAEVTKFTSNYRESTDLYYEFISEMLDDTNNKSETIDIPSLYGVFKSWFKESYVDGKTPSKKELKNYMYSKYGDRIKNGSLVGFTFKIKENLILNNLDGF
jgi:phage/plasmid-associated DNA primase